MRNFIGYMFTNYHIHPQNLILPVFLSILIETLKGVVINFYELKLNFSQGLIFIVLLYSILSVGINSTWIIVGNFNYLVRTDLRSYDARMKAVWGDFYDYIKFVQVNTDKNSVITHPPQANPWQMEGNQLVSRYFLYPRILNSGVNSDFYDITKNSDWLMITNGEPKFYPAQFVGYPLKPINLHNIKLLTESEVKVKPISIILHKKNYDKNIDLSKIEDLNINSDSVLSKNKIILESIDPNVTSITLKVYANSENVVSVYQKTKNLPEQLIESESNINPNNNVYEINYRIDPNFSGSLYIRVTNEKPLPYLYLKAIGRIAKEKPAIPEFLSANYYAILGNYYYIEKEPKLAKQAYLEALSLKQDCAEALLGMHYIALENNELTDAQSYALRLKDILPKDEKLNIGAYLLANMKEETTK